MRGEREREREKESLQKFEFSFHTSSLSSHDNLRHQFLLDVFISELASEAVDQGGREGRGEV